MPIETGILILTGPPGAGKTTTGELVARAWKPRSVHLLVDDFFDRYIKSGYILPWLPESAAQNSTALHAAAAAARAYAAAGYQVVADGIVGPWFLDLWRQTRREGDPPLHYAVLRAAPERSVDRVRDRGTHGLLASGPVRALNQQFRRLGPLERHVLETDELTPTQAADWIIENVAAGRLRL
jgi:thymidylate kinase